MNNLRVSFYNQPFLDCEEIELSDNSEMFEKSWRVTFPTKPNKFQMNPDIFLYLYEKKDGTYALGVWRQLFPIDKENINFKMIEDYE
jgi:hypothetical protein